MLSELVKWTSKQNLAFKALFSHKYILYGGARGPGKSYWLRWSFVMLPLYYTDVLGIPGARVGLFCEDYPSLKDRQISKINKEFPIWLGKLKSTQTDGLGFYINESLGGGMVALRNLDDPTKYQSAEFAAIGVDELTKNSYDTFNVLRGSLRWPGIPHNPFAGATNPGGPGHLWVKRIWIDHNYPSELVPKADQFQFIKALPKDNPHLSQSYWDELNSLPEPLRSAWVDGNWDVFAGMAFPAWREDLHLIDPIELPGHWPRWRAVDWGYSAPFCCLWLAKDPVRGTIYVYREAYARELSDREQAMLIREMTAQNETIIFTYADPSMWQSMQWAGRKTSTADEYAAVGVMLTQADNNRLSGKRKVDRALANGPDGRPGLQIFRTCKNLAETLPALPYDETNVEDVDTDAEDHAYDALRYGLTALLLGAADKKKKVRTKSPLQTVRGI